MTRKIKIAGILRTAITVWFSIFFLISCKPASNKEKQPTDYSTTHTPKVDTILITGMSFEPRNITVREGDTLLWINKDLVAHCVTESGSKAWTSSNIPTNGEWKMAVKQSADYYCALHPSMKGSIRIMKDE